MPWPARQSVRITGFPSRTAMASVFMMPRSQRTYWAMSVLLMTRMSDSVMPGPRFFGIFCPSAVSRTKTKTSTSAGENVRVRLSPPDSKNTVSISGCSSMRSAAAMRFIVGSSRTAVCGQEPVSTPTIRSGSMMPSSSRRTWRASSWV